jgi:hypothetical protein
MKNPIAKGDYTKITADDLLRYIDRTHPVGGKGNCLCSTCEAYGIICHAVGVITNRRAEVQRELAEAKKEMTA